MYADYFGLAEIPFRVTPDPRFLWYSEQHLEAKSKIHYHITESAGPIYLLAEVGTGKTTLARRIVEELSTDKNTQVVFIAAPKLTTTNAFLRFVMEEFGVKTDRAYGRSLKNFEQFLLAQYEAGKTTVLLVDEAQNMTRDMLLLIQHLFNFSTNTEFLVQMVLFAQPELQPKLSRLRSLQSRMSIARLKPFDLAQTREMLRFRWSTARGNDLPFTVEAIEQIFTRTKGIPRDIVKLANEALIKAAVDGKHEVDVGTVKAAVTEISVEEA